MRRPITVALVGGLAVTLPFMVLEWMTRSDAPRSAFAFPLFLLLWTFAAVFFGLAIGVIRTTRSARSGRAVVLRSVSLVPQVALLVAVAWAWTSWVIDQWPCFLGATGC